MMKAVEMFTSSTVSAGKKLILGVLMTALIAGAPPEIEAQGYWGWPPPPQYYPYAPPPPPPERRPSRPRDNRPKPKSTPKPKPKKTPAPKPDKDEKKADKKNDSSKKKDTRPQSDSPRDEGQAQATQTPEETAVDSSPIESANPYSGRRSNNRPAGMPSHSRVASDAGTVMIWDNSDSLTAIARVAGLTPSELLEYNRIGRTELRAGQALVLPQSRDLGTANSSNALPKALAPSQQITREVWRGVRGKKRVALTFDAGSGTDGVQDLLGHLQGTRAAATFFVTGDFVRKNRAIIEQMDQAGYPVYNHSWSHPEFTKISEEKMREELNRTDEIIQEVTGKPTRPYWRPPYGDRNSRVLRTAGDEGFQSIYWTIDVLDTVGEKKSSAFVINRVLNPSKAGGKPDHYLDGAIILMHVGEPRTAAAIPEIVHGLRERGFTLVTVDEILKP